MEIYHFIVNGVLYPNVPLMVHLNLLAYVQTHKM